MERITSDTYKRKAMYINLDRGITHNIGEGVPRWNDKQAIDLRSTLLTCEIVENLN